MFDVLVDPWQFMFLLNESMQYINSTDSASSERIAWVGGDGDISFAPLSLTYSPRSGPRIWNSLPRPFSATWKSLRPELSACTVFPISSRKLFSRSYLGERKKIEKYFVFEMWSPFSQNGFQERRR